MKEAWLCNHANESPTLVDKNGNCACSLDCYCKGIGGCREDADINGLSIELKDDKGRTVRFTLDQFKEHLIKSIKEAF